MEDHLKKFVESNRQEFELPAEGLDALWGNIAQGLSAKQQKQLPLWKQHTWRVAASLVFILAATWLLWPRTQPEPLAEWQETQQFYQSEIDEKLQMLQAKNGSIDPIVAENLAMLDQAMQELKRDLGDQANSEEVVGAMIENYQLKLKILEEILQQLQQHEKDSNTVQPHRGA